MKTDEILTHITDDMGNDVLKPLALDHEYECLCAVAEAAEETHRAHCLLPTVNCPLCKTLADLDEIRIAQRQSTAVAA